MKILKVISATGIYLTQNTENKPWGQNVISYEFIEMREEEYEEFPKTEEAEKFFQGKLIAQRAD